MHMSDALISPAVGAAFWAVAGGWLAHCARRLRNALRESLAPRMGVLGAFVFAAQMINFAIPGTGSSGHLGGGLLLAILLGPHAAFLAIASVLAVQALFFADGGLLALGCNLFNLGFFPAFVAYPLLYRPLAGGAPAGSSRAWFAAVAAGVVGLQLGALGVVVETRASGLAALPFDTFLMLMLPVHLAIGLGEGAATAAVVAYVARRRPAALAEGAPPRAARPRLDPVAAGLVAATLCIGGVASWFASARPDGLEWSVARITGQAEPAAPEGGLHQRIAGIQERTALMPGYAFPTADDAWPAEESWPAVSPATSLAGVTGGLLTVALAGLAGLLLGAGRRRK